MALSKNPQTGPLAQVLEEARSNYAPPAPVHPPPADREPFRHSATMVKKLGRDCATLRKRAVRWRLRLSGPVERPLQPYRTVTRTRGHDWVACVVKAVRASYVYVTAYMTSTTDARCPENVSKLRPISNLLLKQRREFVVAADWNIVLEQLETTNFLRLVGGCVIELAVELGTCYSGRSIDYLVVIFLQALCHEHSSKQECSLVRCDAQAVKGSDVAAGLPLRCSRAGPAL